MNQQERAAHHRDAAKKQYEDALAKRAELEAIASAIYGNVALIKGGLPEKYRYPSSDLWEREGVFVLHQPGATWQPELVSSIEFEETEDNFTNTRVGGFLSIIPDFQEPGLQRCA